MHKNRTDVIETDVVIFPMDNNNEILENEYNRKKNEPKTDKIKSNVTDNSLTRNNKTFAKTS